MAERGKINMEVMEYITIILALVVARSAIQRIKSPTAPKREQQVTKSAKKRKERK